MCCLPLDPTYLSRQVMFILVIYPHLRQASRPLVTTIHIEITVFPCQVSVPKSCSLPVKCPAVSPISSLFRSAFKLCALTIETGCFTGKQILSLYCSVFPKNGLITNESASEGHTSLPLHCYSQGQDDTERVSTGSCSGMEI